MCSGGETDFVQLAGDSICLGLGIMTIISALYLLPLSNGTRPFICGNLLLSILYIVFAVILFWHTDPWYVALARILVALILLWTMWSAALLHSDDTHEEKIDV